MHGIICDESYDLYCIGNQKWLYVYCTKACYSKILPVNSTKSVPFIFQDNDTKIYLQYVSSAYDEFWVGMKQTHSVE